MKKSSIRTLQALGILVSVGLMVLALFSLRADLGSSSDTPEAAAEGSAVERDGRGGGAAAGVEARPVDPAHRQAVLAPEAKAGEGTYAALPGKDLHAALKQGPRWEKTMIALDDEAVESYEACHHHLEPDEVCEFDVTLALERADAGTARVAWAQYETYGSSRCQRYAFCASRKRYIGKTVPWPAQAPDRVAHKREGVTIVNALPSLLEEPEQFDRHIANLEAGLRHLERAGPSPDQTVAEYNYYRAGIRSMLAYMKRARAGQQD